ncbi:MAG TPA: hypothetical protein DHW02_21920 [Ktedonobacter sp.]|nr:hypothetical protein [Ktedonobacter sp.]
MTDNNRQTQWDEMYACLSKTPDKLGRGIDAGIMDTVVVLNLLEMPTTMSCEGHLERAAANPWVHVGNHEGDKEFEGYFQLMQEARNAHEQGQPSKHLFEQAHAKRRAVRQKQLVFRQKLVDYLDMFYTQRFVPYDMRLVIQDLGDGTSRLENQGADLQEIVSLEEKQQKLLEYQAEMQAFTTFLKEQFFQKPLQEM